MKKDKLKSVVLKFSIIYYIILYYTELFGGLLWTESFTQFRFMLTKTKT